MSVDGAKQYYVNFTADARATSIAQAVHIAIDQVEEGTAHIEVTDEAGVLVEPDVGAIMADRRAKEPPVYEPARDLTYELVANAAHRLARSLTEEQRDLLAALGTAETPEKAQIVRDILQAVLDEAAPPTTAQLDALVLGNLRNAVGRPAAEVAATVGLVAANWDALSVTTRQTIGREAEQAQWQAGSDAEEQEWQRMAALAAPGSSPKA
ncbi:hypothetical protein [Methylobacterium radiotolerans]|uniref:hypothetical protein n=1 Tax=Methylobacterium radiotolerans TaxID=31998 RepID=UPI0038D03BD5